MPEESNQERTVLFIDLRYQRGPDAFILVEFLCFFFPPGGGLATIYLSF
jgi:hypothetical protein